MEPDSEDRRHVELNDDELDQERQKVKKKNTVKSDRKCDKILIDYLKQVWSTKVENYEYWTYSPELIDKILTKFWFEVRQKNRDRYTVNSLKHLRYAINRNFKKKGCEFDILKSECFSKNQLAFADATKLLKQLGYGVVKHYEEIKPKGK